MFKRIFGIFIGAGIVLYALVLIWPAAAKRITNTVVNGIVAIETGRVALIGTEPVIKIVDPETVTAVIKEETPQFIAIFQKDRVVSANLTVEDIIDATNAERLKAGVPPLKVNTELNQSAQLKTDDMITKEYFEHTSPTGVTVSDLGGQVGYDYLIMGENLALGNFTDSNDLVAAWMASPGHRANILNPLYQDIGVYVATGNYEGHEVWFAVQHFGAGRGACPTISKSFKQQIDATNADLNNRQLAIEVLKGDIEHSNSHDADYDEKVERFNKMVNEYNAELAASRDKISQYNEQVRAFNTCLSKYQK